MRILCVTPMYPEPDNPAFGSFVARLNDALEAHTDCEVEVLRRPAGRRGAWSYAELSAGALTRVLRGGPYDLVHGHYAGVAAGVALAAAELLRRPLVITAHGSDIESATKPLPRRLLRLLFDQCAGVHFV